MKLTNLKTEFLGRNAIYYKEIDSTQSEIWRKVEELTNGSLVMADFQTLGKGTHGRRWHTDEAGNIAFSFLIKMDYEIRKLEGLTLEIAQIIVDIMKAKYKININIKEPNDLIINNKKVGGILTETKLSFENVKYLVIGIGINTSKQSFTEDIKDTATSIKKEFNVDVDVVEFVTEFCNVFEEKFMRRIESKL